MGKKGKKKGDGDGPSGGKPGSSDNKPKQQQPPPQKQQQQQQQQKKKQQHDQPQQQQQQPKPQQQQQPKPQQQQQQQPKPQQQQQQRHKPQDQPQQQQYQPQQQQYQPQQYQPQPTTVTEPSVAVPKAWGRGAPRPGGIRPSTAPPFGPPQQGQPRPSTAPPQQMQPRPPVQKSDSPQIYSSQSTTPSRSSSSSSVSAGSSPQKNDEVTRKMQNMTLASLSLPVRDKPGSFGRVITIETNHLELKFADPNIKIYHYDVDIKPDKPFRLYRRVVDKFQKVHYPRNFFGFDGKKNIFTNVRMDEETVAEFVIFDPEKSADHKGIEYKIVVKFANEFRLSKIQDYFRNGSSLQPPQIMIQALDVALRHPAYENPKFVSVGRSFFSAPKDGHIISLGGGLNLWYGFYQSAILGWKPLLNVDVAHKGFPEAVNCIQALRNILEINDARELDKFQWESFRNYMKGLKVIYEIPNQPNSKRTYRITNLADPPNKKRFVDEKEGNRETTVADYFARKKNCRLRYPDLPSLQAGPKTATRDCCLPLELCTIMEGQVLNKKLDEKQTALMVRNAAKPTDVRKDRIMNSIREIKYNNDPCVRQFGISVNNEFEKIEARIVPSPDLKYEQGSSKVREGVWNPGRFISPNNVDNWAIVNLDFRTSEQSLRNIQEQFSRTGRDVGMNVSTPEIRTMKTKRGEDIRPTLKKTFDELQKDYSVKLVVVVIPNFGDSYGKVKQVAELASGVLTQCLKAKTVERNLNRSTVSNILLKLNAKLNGVNHSLIMDDRFNFLRRPIIIFGADVTHPSPDQTDIPSVAAVTASFDVNAFRYNVEWLVQEARLEIIEGLDAIIKSHLMHFYRMNKAKPEKIVFYRDGVSEGQFKEVLDKEVMAIRRACKSLQLDYEPAVTFLVVQKRHHTRFFPISDRDSQGRNKNVPAGTVVDKTITHPTEKDFYLNSHASIQGTSRPTKYHVLWDDANRSMDDLQMMTYYLCHLFTRCTRSISFPAPTYYAHLAAFRIRAYCEGKSMDLWDFKKNPKLKEVQQGVSKSFPMFFV